MLILPLILINYLFYKKVYAINVSITQLKPNDVNTLSVWSIYGYSCICNGMLTHNNGALVNPRYIVNFPTKRHWRDSSRLEDVVAGLQTLVADVQRLGIRSIAIPPLGCGLGGLAWCEVKPLIVEAFSALPDVRVLLYEPL